MGCTMNPICNCINVNIICKDDDFIEELKASLGRKMTINNSDGLSTKIRINYTQSQHAY